MWWRQSPCFGTFGDREGADGLRDILEALLAEGPERQRQLVADLIVDAARNADPAGLRRCLQPGRDIAPFAEQVSFLHHDIAEIDADPNPHLPLRRELVVARAQRG